MDLCQTKQLRSYYQGAGRFLRRGSFETGGFDAITTALISDLLLSIAVANEILPRARREQKGHRC